MYQLSLTVHAVAHTDTRQAFRIHIVQSKLLRIHLIQQNEEKRIEFMAEMAALKAEVFVWLDESGFDRRNAI